MTKIHFLFSLFLKNKKKIKIVNIQSKIEVSNKDPTPIPFSCYADTGTLGEVEESEYQRSHLLLFSYMNQLKKKIENGFVHTFSSKKVNLSKINEVALQKLWD